VSDGRSGEDRSDVEEIAAQYTTAELRQICLDNGLRVDRSWGKEGLIDLLLNPEKYPETVNSFDEFREKIISHVNKNRQQLAGVIKCPLKDDERGCYQCSDAMITVCWLTNKDKIGGTE
jgi:hypothetical protein